MAETQVFTMRFDRKTRAELDALASKADRTQAWVIRDLVRKAAVRNGIVVPTLPQDKEDGAARPPSDSPRLGKHQTEGELVEA